MAIIKLFVIKNKDLVIFLPTFYSLNSFTDLFSHRAKIALRAVPILLAKIELRNGTQSLRIGWL